MEADALGEHLKTPCVHVINVKIKIIRGYYSAKLYKYFILEMGLFNI